MYTNLFKLPNFIRHILREIPVCMIVIALFSRSKAPGRLKEPADSTTHFHCRDDDKELGLVQFNLHIMSFNND